MQHCAESLKRRKILGVGRGILGGLIADGDFVPTETELGYPLTLQTMG
jgi:hypothetical protein